jgi:hypothetical protein
MVQAAINPGLTAGAILVPALRAWFVLREAGTDGRVSSLEEAALC